MELQLLAELLFLAAALQPPRNLRKNGVIVASSSGRIQDQSHGAGEGLPFRLLGGQLLAPERREPIVPGALALVGELPGRRDPALRLQPVQRRIERAGLDLQQVFRGPLNVLGDGVAVGRSGEQRAQDQEVERALQELHAGRRLAAHCVGILLYIV